MMTDMIQSTVDRIAAGEQVDSGEIYWDAMADEPGPAYRIGGESGGLYHTGWAGGDAEGYDIQYYFDGDGNYRGPDQQGVYPTFDAD